MAKINVSYREHEENGKIYYRFWIKPKSRSLIGKEIIFEIHNVVESKNIMNLFDDPTFLDRRVTMGFEHIIPQHYTKKLFKQKIILTIDQPVFVDLPKDALSIFTYHGKNISVAVQTQVRLPLKWGFFQKPIKQNHNIARRNPMAPTPVPTKHIIEPQDKISILHNYASLDLGSRTLMLLVFMISILCIAAIMAVGLHDQFSSNSETIFYMHHENPRISNSPMAKAILSSLALASIANLFIKNRLKQYMSLHLKSGQKKIQPNVRYSLRKMISGKSKIDLKNVTIRVVAANMENGVYISRRGSRGSTIHFSSPVNGFVIYEEFIKHIPAQEPIEWYLSKKSFTFNDVFEKLFPPQMFSRSYGLDLRWEIQLINNDLIDQEIVGSGDIFDKESFWEYNRHRKTTTTT